MDQPTPVCPGCSKPIAAGTGLPRAGGEPVHIRCLASQLRLRALEEHGVARELRERARDLTEEAHRLTSCPVCSRPLFAGGGVLFQGERLVHALCWKDRPDGSAPEPS